MITTTPQAAPSEARDLLFKLRHAMRYGDDPKAALKLLEDAIESGAGLAAASSQAAGAQPEPEFEHDTDEAGTLRIRYAAPTAQSNPQCSLSWNGFNLHGDKKSITEAKRLVERIAALEIYLKNNTL